MVQLSWQGSPGYWCSAGYWACHRRGIRGSRARLVISDRQAEKLAHTAIALTSQGYEVVSVPADVTYAGQVREMVEHGLGVYGALDILVNNAGGSGNIGVDDIEDVSERVVGRDSSIPT